jgi:hypothetical protein
MRNRGALLLWWTGLALLIVSVGLPYSIKLLHRLGVLQGWDGFGLFVIGLRVMPWLAGLGLLLLVMAATNRKQSRS